MNAVDKDKCIDYIEFAATDLIETKRFYEDVFGWKFTDYGPDYTSFSDGRLGGGFYSVATNKKGGTLVVIYSADLESIQAKIQSAGGIIVKEIFEFPGGRRFHFADPSRNELAVWSDK